MATQQNTPAAAEQTVRIKLPMNPYNKNDDCVFVAVNGRRFLIRRGVSVDVPACAAEVLAHSEQAAQEAADYIARTAE